VVLHAGHLKIFLYEKNTHPYRVRSIDGGLLEAERHTGIRFHGKFHFENEFVIAISRAAAECSGRTGRNRAAERHAEASRYIEPLLTETACHTN